MAAVELDAFAQTRGPAGGPSHPPSGSGARDTVAHSALGLGPVGRWWDDKSIVQAVGLTKDQTKKMDQIFNANRLAILESYEAFLKEQSKLDALSKDPQVDKARLFAGIDAASQARALLQKTTTQMLLQIRRQMNPDQIARLDKLR
jgi:Spy/CpxP family protein refolding chaperone